jgi:hypothetical protein
MSAVESEANEVESATDVLPTAELKIRGEAPIRSEKQGRNPEQVDTFLDRFYVPLHELAREMEISPELLLGLAVKEHGWQGTGSNNLFGLTDGDGKIRTFATPEDSIAAFRQTQWFDRLQGIRHGDALVLAMTQRPMYNAERAGAYYRELRNVVDTVNRRLPLWRTQWPSP